MNHQQTHRSVTIESFAQHSKAKLCMMHWKNLAKYEAMYKIEDMCVVKRTLKISRVQIVCCRYQCVLSSLSVELFYTLLMRVYGTKVATK